MNELFIGVDGGGTNTRAQLADAEGSVLGAGEAGTSNPMVHGVAAARHELELAIGRAFSAAERPRERVAALCMGLGGAGRAREQGELVEWARREIAERVEIVNDGEIVMAAGTPENWGVAVIAGTGSLVWGRNRDGETARAGGWGYLIGDEGSGFDLARGALRAATQFADRRGEQTLLLDAILEYWNLSAPHELVTKVYRSGLKHADLAKLAPLVLRHAGQGDAVALGLAREGAEALARGVRAVSAALHLDTAPFPLALTGGVLLNSEFYRARLFDALEALHCACAPVELVHQPVIGAVRLARQIASAPLK
jgi:N-acetylglucosamine kinase-like BadF-type ATPase